MVQNQPANAGDASLGLSPFVGQKDSPEGENGNVPQDSCLENFTERGAWRATVYGATESWT